ncbi:MAG: ice-binding family protein [Solirubrobacterales bacterium]
MSLVLFLSLALAGAAQAATAVGLGTADSYAILAGAGVTNTGPSVINGDLGTFPTPSVTGFGGAPNGTVNGATHQGDAAAALAKDDLTTAYNNAAGQGPPNTLATELGGQTLTPGVYTAASGTFGITGALTLNAQGNPGAVFIFQTATTLVSATASQVNMINGAQACNVFWKVGSSATLGTSSVFRGNILALQSISLNNGVAVDGRLLARNGAVTLINDTVNRPACAPGTGGGGGTGGEGGGGGKGKGKNGNGNNGNGSFVVRITGVPGSGPGNGGPGGPGTSSRCTDTGFRASLNIRHRGGMRSIRVYVDGKLIKQGTNKRMSFWVNVSGLRSGRNTIRVVAVAKNGDRSSSSQAFRRCAPALPAPNFTG